MSWIIAIIVGGIVGWIASALVGSNQNILVDIIVGIVGAVLARWFFGTVLGIGSALAAGTFTLVGIIWAIIGAVILIVVVRLITR